MSARRRRVQALLRACWAPRERGPHDVLIALAIAAAYLVALLATVSDLGYARDEGFYFQAASSYQHWFELLWRDRSAAMLAVDRYWGVNHEHPALIKSLFALSHWLTWERWRLVSMEGTSYRLAGMLLSSGGVGLVYLWGARARGRLAGLLAALSLAAMPRFFYHAHLACFDTPIVTLWTLTAYLYWRSMQRGHLLYLLATGVSFALALDSKHNSWFLPIVCGLHALSLQLPGTASGLARRVLRRRALATLASMATLGPLLFYAGWPWIWHDTLPRLRDYADFHLRHVYYNMEYFGVNYWRPPMPRSYAFVMTATTVPLVTLAAFGLGVVVAVRRDLRGLGRWLLRRRPPAGARGEALGLALEVDPSTTSLWLLAMAVQYAAWLSPTTPIFGGTKHWMTAYPFLVLFAAEGVRGALLAMRHRWPRTPLRALLRGGALEATVTASVLIAPLLQTLHAHPWALSSYNVLAGGAAGAANLGLNRGFWGYTTGAVAPDIDRLAEPHARIYIHDTARQAWDMLVRDGRIRGDLRPTWDVGDASLALHHHEKHMSGEDYQAWVAFGTASPSVVAGLDGVPVVWLYQKAGEPTNGPTSQTSRGRVKP